jgi:hypothetical protein
VGNLATFSCWGIRGVSEWGLAGANSVPKRQFAAEIIVNAHIWMQVANQLAK